MERLTEVDWDQYPQVNGVCWPTEINGDRSHAWVERDDEHALYPDDNDALYAVIEWMWRMRPVSLEFTFGWGFPSGSKHRTAYVDVRERM